ncbi:MAG: 2-oxo acid dehydrogenase subunit E2 [Verrucomicrobiae bacterium]|nr:2-oxo acid dehydrogenase subunit E2 [Verrucomicrobiae bacterium]
MDVKVPPLGEGADSGVVATGFVKRGDVVRKGDPIVELESDKAVASIPSPVEGRVNQVYVQAGQTVKVGMPLIAVEEAGRSGAVSTLAEVERVARLPKEETKSLAEPTITAVKSGPVILATAAEQEPVAPPAIRKVAKQLGIDLRRVRPSGRGGRIVWSDLRDYVVALQQAVFAARSVPATGGVLEAAPAKQQAVAKVDFGRWGPVTRQPLTHLRRLIAQRMQQSSQTVARVTQFDEADFTVISGLRKRYQADYEKAGVRLTVTPLVLKAVATVLQKHPLLNASLDEEAGEVVLKHYYHIGVAVDTEQGLIVPVVRDVDRKSVMQLAREVEDLAMRTRERKVAAEELHGGSFTISNQGAIGSGAFTPIVNLPETAILGLGRAGMKPVVRDGQIVARLMVPLALSYDHRLVDGAEAARFMVDLVQALENFPEDQVRL